MKTCGKYLNSGLTLVEVMIATSIILVFLLALFGTYNMYLKAAFSGSSTVKAAYLAEEGIEAVRFLRDSSWASNIAPLASGTDYGLVFESGLWQVTSGNFSADGLFERKLTFSGVYRNPSFQIVSSGGTLDPDTRLVIASVSWRNGTATTTKSVSTYITNLRGN